MRKHIPHPIAQLTSDHAELDILFGGNEADAIEESMKIARDLREKLREDENILYVNTLVSERRMAVTMNKRFEHGLKRGRNYFITYCSGEIVQKLALLRHMCEEKNFTYLVITGFELAALHSRHRTEFLGWLRVMRNAGVNIILFTVSQPRNFGTLGSLRYSARSVQEVGAYLAKSNGQQYEDHEETIDTFEEVDTGVAELAIEEEIVAPPDHLEHEAEFADAPYGTMLYTNALKANPDIHSPEDPETQHSDSEALKTKDLALEFA